MGEKEGGAQNKKGRVLVCASVELTLEPGRRQVGCGGGGGGVGCSSQPTPLLLWLLVGIILRRPPSLRIRPLFFPVYFPPVLGWRGFCLSGHLCVTPPSAERKRGTAGFSAGRGKGKTKRCQSETKREDGGASWLNERGQRATTMERAALLFAEAIN